MAGETKLELLIRGMNPRLNEGEYIFTTVTDIKGIDRGEAICEFRETEGTTLVIEKKKADELKLKYEFISAWISLEIHSSLEAVGLTALFSTELAKNNISCNIIAGYYHDHIFVNKGEAKKAMAVLRRISESKPD